MTELGIFYHATPVENLNSILMSGITTSQDGMVHLTRDEVAAVKYCASRGLRKIATLRIRLDDLSKVADILDSGCDLYNPSGTPPKHLWCKAEIKTKALRCKPD